GGELRRDHVHVQAGDLRPARLRVRRSVLRGGRPVRRGHHRCGLEPERPGVGGGLLRHDAHVQTGYLRPADLRVRRPVHRGPGPVRHRHHRCGLEPERPGICEGLPGRDGHVHGCAPRPAALRARRPVHRGPGSVRGRQRLSARGPAFPALPVLRNNPAGPEEATTGRARRDPSRRALPVGRASSLLVLRAAESCRCWAPSLLGLGAAGPRRCCFLVLPDLGAAEAQRRGTRRCEASSSRLAPLPYSFAMTSPLSDPPAPASDRTQRMDLVMEGGGVKGIALAGALEVLEERGYRVNRAAGSSAGSIAAALATAGIPAATIVEILRETDYRRFEDGPWWTRPLIGKGLSILLHNGIHRGRYLTAWLEEQLASHGAPGRTG